MKILYVFPKFPVQREAFARSDIEALIAAGHDVRILSYRDGDMVAEDYGDRIMQAPCFLIASLKSLLSPVCFLKMIGFSVCAGCGNIVATSKSIYYGIKALAMRGAVRKFKPDVIHCFWGHYPTIFLKLYPDDVVKTMFLGAYDLNEKWQGSVKIANEHADIVFTHAARNLEKTKSLGISDDKLEIIYRGIHLPSEPQSTSQRSLRLMSAGALIAEKGHDAAIRLCAKLKQAGLAPMLDIAGRGHDQASLKKLTADLGLKKDVNFLGHVLRDELYARMRDAKYFIAMSKHRNECLPNVVKEAMANGAIVLVSDSYAIDELVRDKQTGFVFTAKDTRNINALCDTICALEDDAAKVDKIAADARAHVAALFDRDKNMGKYLERWDALLKKKAG